MRLRLPGAPDEPHAMELVALLNGFAAVLIVVGCRALLASFNRY
jgi:hypothetical protein